MKQVKANTVLRRIVRRRESVISMILIVTVAIMALLLPNTFLTQENIFNILKQISIVSIVAIGQTYIIITGGIDLSVGYSLGFCGIILSKCLSLAINPVLSIFLGIASSVLIGFINGFIITKLDLPPFIATLGTANIARGLTYIITKGFPISLDNDFVLALGNGYWGAIPIMSVVMILLVVLSSYFLTQNAFGNRVLAIGGNTLAARLSGIPVHRYKIIVYAATGLLCGIAGVIMTGRLNSGNPNAGLNFDMDSIAAAIVGGTSMSGGEGSVIGTLLGALLLGVIRNSLVLLNTNMYWQTVVIGIIIIAVCGTDHVAQRAKSRA